MGYPAFVALIDDAMQAPEHVTEVRDAEGRLARIQRDPEYPGAVCVRLDATEEEIWYTTHWTLPAVGSRPTFYPSDVPFVPDLGCRAREAPGRLYAAWAEGDRSTPDPELVKQFQDSMPAPLKEMLESMKRRAKQGELVKEVSLEQLAEQLGDESVPQWAASVTKASQPDERFIAVFDGVLEACVESGWQEVASTDEVPSTARTVYLRRGNSRRALVLTCALGIGRLLMTEGPADAPDSA